MKIETGAAEQHPGVLPLDPQPPVAPPPAVASLPSGTTVPARDCTGEQLAQQAAVTADIAAAQAAGHAAELDRRAGYHADILPAGAAYGDLLQLPGTVSAWSKHTAGSDAQSYDPAG